jgi:hypothetical protein
MVDEKRKKVTEYRLRFKKGYCVGYWVGRELYCGLERKKIFTQTVARRIDYGHRDGRNVFIF